MHLTELLLSHFGRDILQQCIESLISNEVDQTFTRKTDVFEVKIGDFTITMKLNQTSPEETDMQDLKIAIVMEANILQIKVFW